MFGRLRTLAKVVFVVPVLLWIGRLLRETAIWTAPITWDGSLVTVAELNEQIRDNLEYLLDANYPTETLDETDKTTTSTTFADVDAAGNPDLSLSITTSGEDLFIAFVGMIAVSNSGGNIAQAVHFDVTVDGVRLLADDGQGYYKDQSAMNNSAYNHFLLWRTTGLAAGLHTINLQWKVYAASGTTTATMFCGNATVGRDTHPRFF